MRVSFQGTLCAVVLLCLGTVASAAHHGDEPAVQRAVLVTGASSGIGRKITEVLASNGHFVYAGARKQKDMDELNAIENVQAVRLDVTRQEDIDAAVETVRSGGRGLWGLVNNAGVSIHAPLIEVPEEEMKWLFDVNVFGVLRVTQAFAPLIIESRGRITTTGSIAGMITGTFYGPYSMSKHAIEAYTDALAMEMARFDVKVSVIEPGSYKSRISENRRARAGELTETKKNSPYAEEYAERHAPPTEPDSRKDPDDVAAAAMHALFDENPLPRYLVTPGRGQAEWVMGIVMSKVAQLAQGDQYTFSREELIAMLDKALGGKD
jgi:NAD(P)-dependent dehydrogenase (short-subunit alcohol dehydrogenase family)